MKIYGTLKTNLGKIFKETGKECIISVDSIKLETDKGEEFDIDFDEGDYITEDSYISFRLKGLGDTFSDSWVDILGRDDKLIMENDYEVFNGSTIKSISLYISEEDYENIQHKKLNISLTELEMYIQDKDIEFDTKDTEILI